MIYLDNASTTQVVPEVAKLVLACLEEDFGNPSSAHRLGIAASQRIKAARERVLAAIADERGAVGDLLWTSGGTEADALAVIGAARARARTRQHLVLSAIEHPAVLGSAQLLAAEGFSLTLVPVSRDGVVSAEAVADAVNDETSVVACMLVNNELGTIQPVADLARLVRAKNREIHVHCDAVQGLGKIPVDVRALGVDSLAFSGHKLHAPKGIGALWVRRGARLTRLWSGGGQQGGLRSGTENVAGIVAFAEAAHRAVTELGSTALRTAFLRARLEKSILQADLGVRINGEGAPRAPAIASLSFPGVPAEPLLHSLEGRGVYVSAGSACASQSHHPSHVLDALGVPEDMGTIRVSLSKLTTEADIDTAAQVIVDEARKLRAEFAPRKA
jgi:cysteine desulfurase